MRDIVIFDLGGVLIDWDPRHLYRRLFAGDEQAMERFLATVCTLDWHKQHDAGVRFADSREALKRQHPDAASLIDAWGDRHMEMFAGAFDGTVDILNRLAARKTQLYALTNFPAETFPTARRRFGFLGHFRDIAVSGDERIMKPDPRLFHILLERNRIDPQRAVFIDDSAANVATAGMLGMHAIRFVSPPALEAELTSLGLLDRGQIIP
jgi:2-haloacid dehalogenase